MSEDADVESDSAVSRNDLNETKDDINIDEPLRGHSSYEIVNDRPEHSDDIVSFRSKHSLGRVELKFTIHYMKPFHPQCHLTLFLLTTLFMKLPV